MKHLIAAALLALPTPALADWSWEQRPGFAKARTVSGNYILELSCRQGDQALEMSIFDQTLRGDAFPGLRSVMMWITLPDGRTHRQAVDVFQEDASISGIYYVSDFTLDFFRNGRSYEVDIPTRGGEKLMQGNMKGSGAARLAFLEQCGL